MGVDGSLILLQDGEGRLQLEVIAEIGEGEELLINYLDRPVMPWRHERQRCGGEGAGGKEVDGRACGAG